MILKINLTELSGAQLHQQVTIRDHKLDGIDGHYRVSRMMPTYALLWRVGGLDATQEELDSWEERIPRDLAAPKVQCSARGSVRNPGDTRPI